MDFQDYITVKPELILLLFVDGKEMLCQSNLRPSGSSAHY